MNKIAVTFLLGTASAILFSASFLTTDAAGYMDWAKESAPAIHQEMKSFKSSLPFHSIKEDKEGSHDRKDKVKKERKEKDRSPYDEKTAASAKTAAMTKKTAPMTGFIPKPTGRMKDTASAP